MMMTKKPGPGLSVLSDWSWGCDSTVLAAAFPEVGISLLEVSLAFG